MCELEDGSARAAARDLGKGLESKPLCAHPRGGDLHRGGHYRSRRHPAHLDDPHRQLAQHHHPVFWDDQEAPSVECPVGDFFCAGWQEYFQVSTLRCASTPAAPLTATGPCPSASGAASPWRPGRGGSGVLLPGGLQPGGGAGGRRLFPRPVPPCEPPALQAGVHHPGRGEGPGPVCGHLHGLGP